jgi:hypothetical protein
MLDFKEKIIVFKGSEVADEFYSLIIRTIKDAVVVVGTDEKKLDQLRWEVSGAFAEIKNLQAQIRHQKSRQQVIK